MRFTTQLSSNGCIIRDENGNFVMELATEDEALEWIEDNENSYNDREEVHVDLYDQFVAYCKKLPGKCFLDRRLATTNEKALKRFIQSFEKARNAKVRYYADFLGGEYFFIVHEVEEN